MKSHLQFLGAGSVECGSHSLYYFLDQHRMLINVSEGVQRLACQYRLKIAPTKLSAIFLTRLDWECFGGLPGLILTMGDTARLINDANSAKPLKIIGPKGLAHAIAAMRPFLHRRDFAVDVTELCIEEEISHWRDERADVDFWAVELFAEKSKGSEVFEAAKDLNVGNIECTEEAPHHFLLRMFQSEYSVSIEEMDRQERCREYAGRLSRMLKYEGQRSLALLIQGPTQPGKFDRAAAVARGVKPGPLFGQLGRGESVTLPSGEVVHPDCCVGPKRPSPAALILDLPSRDMFKAAKSNLTRLVELMKRADAPGVQSVVHMIDRDLLTSEEDKQEYLEFCKSLSQAYGNANLEHIFSATNNAMLMSSSIKLQRTLSETLKSPFFPSGQQAANFICKLSQGIVAKPFDKIILSPEEPVSIESTIDWADYEAQAEDTAKDFDQNDIYVSTLGTGSAIPGKYRNVSSSLIENNPAGEVLFLDCGEMTLGQVYRLFGPEKAEELLAKTSAILVSHKHGDHHLGALALIRKICQLRRKESVVRKLLLIAPQRFLTWLDEFAQVSDFGLEDLDFKSADEFVEVPIVLTGSETQIRSFEVDHCMDAFGFQITFADGKRIVYSGDTRPCDNLIANAHECDLLVNEATMSDDLLHEAIVRKHCTISEAIDVAIKAQAKNILLTHFSQRYAKGALTVDQSKFESVVMGVDLLRFPLGKFASVAQYTSILPTLLPVDEEVAVEE